MFDVIVGAVLVPLLPVMLELSTVDMPVKANTSITFAVMAAENVAVIVVDPDTIGVVTIATPIAPQTPALAAVPLNLWMREA